MVNNTGMFSITIFCFGILHVNNGARILGVFPFPSISHQVVFRALMEELAKRGHHLVVMTPDPVAYAEPELENLTQIDVHDISYNHWNSIMNFASNRMESNDPLALLRLIIRTISEVVELQFQHPEMQKLLKNPKERFDLCILEIHSHGIRPLKERFGCPVIYISSLSGMWNNHNEVGNPTHPTLYPDLFNTKDQQTIWERFLLVKQYIYRIYLNEWSLTLYESFVEKYFGKTTASIEQIGKNVDMVFLNYHPILMGVRPMVPAIITLGSMHIKPVKPLPSTLQRVLDDARHGVVYFSLGSNVKSVQLPEEIRKTFLDAFRVVPYTVLWKWENDSLPDQPSNVFISKWLPQQDVLHHPNIKLFITQCGQQSLEEAIHNSVPMIAIPFMCDQDRNADIVLRHGIGQKLSIVTITKEKIKKAISEVIENPTYRTNIGSLREKLYDQPQSPMERAVWWTEYVLRHRGARHLRSPAVDIPLHQYLMLDLLGVVLAITVLALLMTITVVRILTKFLCSKKPKRRTKYKFK